MFPERHLVEIVAIEPRERTSIDPASDDDADVPIRRMPTCYATTRLRVDQVDVGAGVVAVAVVGVLGGLRVPAVVVAVAALGGGVVGDAVGASVGETVVG